MPTLWTVFYITIIIYFSFAEVPPLTLERSRSLSQVFSSIQCLTDTNTTGTSTIVSDINRNFKPESHLSEYKNPKVVQLLLDYIRNTSKSTGFRNDDPFTNSPEHISQMSLILHVLYPNSQNWPLFFNTTAWLINRVNDAQLYWALMVVCGEKFSDSVVAPTAVEVFPQLFINKQPVLEVAGRPNPNYGNSTLEEHPLQYWTSDPGLNEFHLHWHIDNPFWWNETLYGVKRHRKGELFLYMHHQVLCRYIAEQLSNGVPEVQPIELDLDYQIPEPYYPDIVNVNYMSFPPRRKREPLRDWDNGQSLQELKTWYDRLILGIDQGYFLKGNGSNNHESLQFDNGTDILGSTTEASTIHSANLGYYGSFHNYLHRFLAGTFRDSWKVPGVEAHSETAIRDPVFFRLHKTVDSIYMRLTSTFPPYTSKDLDFPGVSIQSLEIHIPKQNLADAGSTTPWQWNPRWPFNPQVPILTTYFNTETYDISTAARPCRSIKDKPTYVNVRTLNYVPFKFVLAIKSTRKEVTHGMVRIFMWPEYDHNGKKFDIEETHRRAIELDRFRIIIEPNRDTVINRSSLNSSLSRVAPPPGIKTLYKATSDYLKPEMGRACGFPNNLLIPKGTTDGMKFKIIALVTEEPEKRDYVNFPLCGSLNGVPYPDDREMGFPFDRPGTKFVNYEGVCLILGGCTYKNIRDIKVIVRHKHEEFLILNNFV